MLEIDHLEELGNYGMVILKWIFGRVLSGLKCSFALTKLCVGSDGRRNRTGYDLMDPKLEACTTCPRSLAFTSSRTAN
jgi:hypothetical protein